MSIHFIYSSTVQVLELYIHFYYIMTTFCFSYLDNTFIFAFNSCKKIKCRTFPCKALFDMVPSGSVVDVYSMMHTIPLLLLKQLSNVKCQSLCQGCTV